MKEPDVPLRSQSWFARVDRQGYENRSALRALGLPDHVFDGRPVIGIASMWSELNPCDSGHQALAEHVRLGVTEAGGLPLVFPGLAVGESLTRPSPLMYRNLAAMALEELVRSNPLDGVVLMAGCDKTTPALMMGVASADLPAIVVSSGPKMSAHFRGAPIGSGTHIWKIENDLALGIINEQDRIESEAAMSRSIGTCMTMGSASTMACLAEGMGMALPGNGVIPATDARRSMLARRSGAVAVEAVLAGRKPSSILTTKAFVNAVRIVGALGGSTNAVLHLLALARRLGLPFGLDDWDEWGRDVPCLVDLMPAGRFLMDDFFAAGGLGVVLGRLREAGLLEQDAPVIEGGVLADRLGRTECFNDEVIRPLDRPVATLGGLVVLRGSLAPDGAILKPSAATERLLQHTGRAVVFDGLDDFKARIDSPDLDVAADDILVLRGCGPRGYPGMPEVGNMKLPARLVAEGVTDMVRISDARMSGTAYGTVVLHVAPESAVGGPLALVRNGDMIVLDVGARRLDLLVEPADLACRKASLWPPTPRRGYAWLYASHVNQANLGADFDFMHGADPAGVPADSS